MAQKQPQQLQLTEALVRKGYRMAQGKAGVDRPGRFDLAAYATGQRYRYCRDPFRFNGSLNQSNGLVAQASGRGEDHQVHAVVFQLAGHLRRRTHDQGVDVGRQDVAHERKVAVVDCADVS